MEGCNQKSINLKKLKELPLKDQEAIYRKVLDARKIGKIINYSIVYGAGAPKLSKTTGLSIKETKKLISAYWNRNWSIKHLPKDIVTKIVGDQMWLQNPVNNFWYSVREEKDIFSTLNQGTGAFVFDIWLKFMSNHGAYPLISYHDEVVLKIKKGDRPKIKKIIEDSIKEANKVLNLNVNIEVDVKFGDNYAEIH